MSRQQAAQPKVRWDDNTWHVTLPLDDGKVVDAKWKPGVTYVVRIRELSTEQWSFGFETPVTSFTFVDLKPDTEYEFQLRTKTVTGEGPPSFFRVRTDPTGDSGNVVPFPTH